MRIYHLKDLEVGQKEQFSVTITEKKVDLFRCISGDHNPMHEDQVFAEKHGYPDKIVYGMLTSSFLSTLAGMYLPGKYCILQECHSSFCRAVYVGDVLTVTGTVTNVDSVFRRVSVKVEIRNQNQQKVLRGSYVAGVMEEEK